MTVKFLGPAYDGMKYYTHSLKGKGIPWVEQLLRNDPNVPTSPPGGWSWAEEGMRASARLKGTDSIPKSDEKEMDFGMPCTDGRDDNFEVDYTGVDVFQDAPGVSSNPYAGVPVVEGWLGVGGRSAGPQPRITVRECVNDTCPGDD